MSCIRVGEGGRGNLSLKGGWRDLSASAAMQDWRRVTEETRLMMMTMAIMMVGVVVVVVAELNGV